MFTPDERTRLRATLVATAAGDDRITGIALTGSASVGREDRWSDIDLALGLAPGVGPAEMADEWSAMMAGEHGAVDALDVPFRATLYRVFLLASTLQVDVAFAPAKEFGPVADTFRLLHGTALDQPRAGPPDPGGLIGMAWLHALHARSSIARGRWWQAEYMVAGIRERVLALACLRHGLPAVQGRGADDLPSEVTGPLAPTIVGSLDRAALAGAMRSAVAALIVEIEAVDPGRAKRVGPVLREIAG